MTEGFISPERKVNFHKIFRDKLSSPTQLKEAKGLVKKKLILHLLGLAALNNAKLNVVSLHRLSFKNHFIKQSQ